MATLSNIPGAARPGPREDPVRLIAPAAVVVLTFLVFSGSLSNGFVNWDDRIGLLDNTAWRGLGLGRLRWMLTTFDLGPYQPLTWLTLGLDYTVWGVSAFGIHLTSLLLHCGCALAVYFISLRLMKNKLGAAAAALFFSLHPLRVESVAWASQRRDPLAGLFFLWTLLCWLDGRRRRALLCALLSLCAGKPAGLALPAVLLLLDVYPLKRLPANPRLWSKPAARAIFIEKLPFAGLSLCFLALNVFAQVNMGALPTLAQVGWAPRLANSLYSLVFYLGKTLWPAGLSPLYSGWSAAGASLWIGAAAAAALAAAAMLSPRLRPILAAACAFYAMTLLPYLGLLKAGKQIAADRFTYIACLPWALLVAAGLTTAARGRLRPAAAAGTLLVALGAASWRQTRLWHDSVALWRRALSVEPFGETSRPILAVALLERDHAGEAVLYLEEQLRIFPGDFDSRKLLTRIAGKGGYSAASRAKIHGGLAREFLRRGERDKAAWHFRKALPRAGRPR